MRLVGAFAATRIMPHRAIANAILAAEPTVMDIAGQLARMLGRMPHRLAPAARRYLKAFPPGNTRPRLRHVESFVRADPSFRRNPRTMNWISGPASMQPAPAARAWPIPQIETIADLAAWLSLQIGELEWLADLKGLSCHYHYRAIEKPSGGIRLIESPKPRLKTAQRKILTEILDKIPAHAAVHGFRKGHSVRTFVAPHVASPVVLKMDLEDFFPSRSRARVQALFRTMGYPESVADILGGLTTTIAPHRYATYNRPHLPQGAPTSPALANLCAYRADCRLSGLAKAVGAEYTRYADDLAFSGAELTQRFSIHTAAILLEEGFEVNHRKTRLMRPSVRQHLAGLVINQQPNIRRTDFDRLKATLTNCLRHGLESQNREQHPHFRQHLEGKVAWVESIHPARGKRLRALLDRLDVA